MWKQVPIYDVTSQVNVHALRPDFHRLYKGPRILRYDRTPDHHWKPSATQESVYPAWTPLPGPACASLTRAVQAFIQHTPGSPTRVYVKAQRASCPPYSECRVPSLTEHGTGLDLTVTGILCIARENTLGAVHHWTLPSDASTWAKELRPGDLVIFNTSHVHYDISHISPHLPSEEGYVDFLVLFAENNVTLQ